MISERLPEPTPLADRDLPAPLMPSTMDTGRVRLIDALLCPEGIALQTVTLVNRGRAEVRLNGWRLMDCHGRTEALDGLVLRADAPLTVTISGLGARFGMRGGSILLLDGHGQVVHIARYTRRMVSPGRVAELR
jgi:hypothetical protein